MHFKETCGSKVTVTGGAYTYIEAAFGPFAGFLSNNIFWFGACVFSDAAVAAGLADTLKLIAPSFDNEIFRMVFLLSFLVAWLSSISGA